MSIFSLLVVACWIIFIIFWSISSIGVKRNLKGRTWLQSVKLRVIIIIVMLLLVRLPFVSTFFRSIGAKHLSQFIGIGNPTSPNLILSILGVVLSTVGVALAIWARVHLGKNWGMPMSIKEEPDLVTAGPYAYIRHPIYTGMLLGILGSACVGGVFWLTIFVISLGYFLYSIKQEEKLMIKTFPKQYLGYRNRTKALIPFIY